MTTGRFGKLWRSSYLCTYANEPVKEGCYLHSKVKLWKDKIRTDFHGKDIPYNQYCKATAVLKVAFSLQTR